MWTFFWLKKKKKKKKRGEKRGGKKKKPPALGRWSFCFLYFGIISIQSGKGEPERKTLTKSCGAVEPPGPVQTKVKVVGLVIGGETSPAKLEGGFEPVQPPEAVHGVGPDVLVEVQVRKQK